VPGTGGWLRSLGGVGRWAVHRSDGSASVADQAFGTAVLDRIQSGLDGGHPGKTARRHERMPRARPAAGSRRPAGASLRSGMSPGRPIMAAGGAVVGRLAGMAKYDALGDHLQRQRHAVVTLTLTEVGEAVPGGLPASAYRYRAWWSNETAGSHVQARAWLDAGYAVAAVNFDAGTVTFEALPGAGR
jgi:hypothetical protein